MATVTVKNCLVIGSMRKTESNNGRISWKFTVHYDDPASVLYPVGKGVQALRWTGVADSYINNIDTELLEDGITKFLHIDAVPFKYLDKNTSGGGNPPEDPEDDIDTKYETRQVFFPTEWFGVKEGDETDRSNGNISVKTGSAMTSIGELVYKDKAQTEPDYTRCPYYGMPEMVMGTQADRDKIINMIEKRRPTLVYILTFHEKKSLAGISQFEGVNATNFKSSTDTELDPFDITSSSWKFIDQEIISVTVVKKKSPPLTGYKETAYVRLKRIFERAPEGLTWKGTPWTW